MTIKTATLNGVATIETLGVLAANASNSALVLSS